MRKGSRTRTALYNIVVPCAVFNRRSHNNVSLRSFSVISVFDMFKIGIGPSSSHTVGPMKAGKQFVDDLVNKGLMPSITRVAVDVYGSLIDR